MVAFITPTKLHVCTIPRPRGKEENLYSELVWAVVALYIS